MVRTAIPLHDFPKPLICRDQGRDAVVITMLGTLFEVINDDDLFRHDTTEF